MLMIFIDNYTIRKVLTIYIRFKKTFTLSNSIINHKSHFPPYSIAKVSVHTNKTKTI